MSEIDTSPAALRALAIKLDDVYPHKDSDGWIIDETVYALRALADEKEAAGNDATLATVRARLLAAEEARDAARSEAKDEAAEFIFGVLEDALGHPAYSPCDGSETWDGDVAGTVYCILNASGLRNEDTGELATARAEKAEAERDAALRLLSDRPGHAVAGRDFTTVASAVLAAFSPCDPADQCAVAFNLASERKTVEMLRDEAEERALDAEIRAGRMRAALQKIMKTTSNGMRWEDKVVAIEEIASDALEEQEAGK